MTMITCPLCYSNISYKATACFECGFPIESTKTGGTVSIKLPKAEVMFLTKAFITDKAGNELWRGKLGSVVSLYLTEKTKIIINSGTLTAPLEAEIDPLGNPRFEMVLDPGTHWNPHYILNRISDV